MPKSEVIGFIDAGDGASRLEVVLSERNGKDVIALQLSTWHETLGWQAQKTIPFAADKIGQLQRLLSQTRNFIEDRRTPAGSLARVIDFALRDLAASLPAQQPIVPSDIISAAN